MSDDLKAPLMQSQDPEQQPEEQLPAHTQRSSRSSRRSGAGVVIHDEPDPYAAQRAAARARGDDRGSGKGTAVQTYRFKGEQTLWFGLALSCVVAALWEVQMLLFALSCHTYNLDTGITLAYTSGPGVTVNNLACWDPTKWFDPTHSNFLGIVAMPPAFQPLLGAIYLCWIVFASYKTAEALLARDVRRLRKQQTTFLALLVVQVQALLLNVVTWATVLLSERELQDPNALCRQTANVRFDLCDHVGNGVYWAFSLLLILILAYRMIKRTQDDLLQARVNGD